MGYEQALDDLKKRFVGKLLLTPEDIAPLIGTTAKAQANQRMRGTFPIALVPQPLGSRNIRISIYALAKYLAGDDASHLQKLGGRAAKPDSMASEESSKSPSEKKRRGRKRKAIAEGEADHPPGQKPKASEIPFDPGRPSIGAELFGIRNEG